MSITNYTKFVDEYNLLHTNKLPKNQYGGSKDNKFVLIFLGKPGAGKGTQLQYMFDRGYIGISVGEVLRSMAKKDTPEAKKLRNIMNSGKLLPSAFVMDLVAKAIPNNRKTGIIFDGCVRQLEQAKALDKILKKKGIKIDAVIEINTPDKVIIKRIADRYVCSSCGAIYNKGGKDTQVKGICDICKGIEFYQRDDDKPSVVKNRLKIYKEKNKPIVNYYKKKGIYYKASGRDGIAENTDKNVMKILKKLK